MSVEAIRDTIEAEVAAEVERLLGDARASADEIVATAEADAETRVAAALDAAEPGLRSEANRRVNQVRARLLERRAQRDAELVGTAFDAAEERLAEVAAAEPDRWRRAIVALATECSSVAGPGSVVLVRPADVEPLTEWAAASPLRLRVESDPGLGAGVVVRSDDGAVDVDGTLDARLGVARTRLAGTVADLLGVVG